VDVWIVVDPMPAATVLIEINRDPVPFATKMAMPSKI
jgi:hypothetical protein